MPFVAFARWDPIRDLLAIQQRLERYAPGSGGWTPPVDLLETSDHYVLTAEVPGLQRDDLQVHVQDGVLTLSGVRRERRVACEQFHRLERGHGSFTRRFQLQVPVDADQVTADLQDGVLTVTCPKRIDQTVRRIQIS
jgi:HSP20 family protein